MPSNKRQFDGVAIVLASGNCVVEQQSASLAMGDLALIAHHRNTSLLVSPASISSCGKACIAIASVFISLSCRALAAVSTRYGHQ